MTGADWLAALALVLVLEGALPFLAPALWRQAFTRMIEFSDGQLRSVGLGAMLLGLILLSLV